MRRRFISICLILTKACAHPAGQRFLWACRPGNGGPCVYRDARGRPPGGGADIAVLSLGLDARPGSHASRRLVEHFSTVAAIFRASLTELEARGLLAVSAQALATGKSLELAQEEWGGPGPRAPRSSPPMILPTRSASSRFTIRRWFSRFEAPSRCSPNRASPCWERGHRPSTALAWRNGWRSTSAHAGWSAQRCGARSGLGLSPRSDCCQRQEYRGLRHWCGRHLPQGE